jgi:serine protease AprX
MMKLISYPVAIAVIGAFAAGEGMAVSSVFKGDALVQVEDRAVQSKCSERLAGLIFSSPPEKSVKVWIFFADHGGQYQPRRETLSKRSMRRRMMRADSAGDRHDMPVCALYIDAVRVRSLGIRQVSRYFNAVSALVEPSRIPSICSLPYVEKVDLVTVYRRERLTEPKAAPPPLRSDDPLVGTYGGSLDQLVQIRAVDLLELGYNGSGALTGADPVLVCVMDTGFRLDHEAFDEINIAGQWDFVQGDSIVRNDEGDHSEQDRHGTIVLGALAGHHEGDLVGPASGADFLLAKTEIFGTEIQVEEDNWIAGLEWADSAGADIVSSSLGYVDWYTPSMLDGDTPRCTRAADIAAAHGVLVVTAMGNGGAAGDTTLIAPADGDSVIAVGAVDRNGVIAYFSSRGPTADGRIKPDVVALGLGVQSVEYPTAYSYASYNGTSLATPLISGLCAQILEILPELSPVELRNLLTSTSSRSGDPDNVYGYGLADGVAAAAVEPPEEPAAISLRGAYPNPFRTSTKFEIAIPISEPLTVRIYDCRGALVRELIAGRILPWGGTLTWDGTNSAGSRVAAGVYFMHFTSRHFERTFKVLLIP